MKRRRTTLMRSTTTTTFCRVMKGGSAGIWGARKQQLFLAVRPLLRQFPSFGQMTFAQTETFCETLRFFVSMRTAFRGVVAQVPRILSFAAPAPPTPTLPTLRHRGTMSQAATSLKVDLPVSFCAGLDLIQVCPTRTQTVSCTR